jgi:hypothetical protein
MKMAVVQQMIEEYVRSMWTATAISYEDVPFTPDIYEEFLQLTIQMGDGQQRTVTRGEYRTIGLIILTIHVRPAKGSARKLQLADLAADMIISKTILPVAPLVSPAVQTWTPDVIKDPKEMNGWVRAQVSCPFYYDWSI